MILLLDFKRILTRFYNTIFANIHNGIIVATHFLLKLSRQPKQQQTSVHECCDLPSCSSHMVQGKADSHPIHTDTVHTHAHTKHVSRCNVGRSKCNNGKNYLHPVDVLYTHAQIMSVQTKKSHHAVRHGKDHSPTVETIQATSVRMGNPPTNVSS